MEQIKHFMLPENTNSLYKNEAISSIRLTRDVANKINEIVDAINHLNSSDLEWKQTQEGIIRKGVVYMKDNLVNTLADLLKVYDKGEIANLIVETYGEELNKFSQLKVFATPQMFGAVGDGVANDLVAIERAINSLDEGGVLYFPQGTYLMEGRTVTINTPNITLTGDGLIKCDYGFRPKASHFKAIGLRMEGINFSQQTRAFSIENSLKNGVIPTTIENFTFKDCYFNNFFYSMSAIGGAYNYDGTEKAVGYPIRDIVIENCYSKAPTNVSSGHFQCIQVENISYINNRTYGGRTASSYNAIKGNGYIRIIGNYDHDNNYASCEVENGSTNVVIANNTFHSKIWVDDSSSVVVNGNTTNEGISITVGSNVGNTKDVVISNNICRNIRCEQYGTYEGGIIENINIIGNTVKGVNTHGIWIHGNTVQNGKVSNNFITGTNTNDISVQRNAQINCYIKSNFGSGKTLLIAGTGGKVYAVDNYNVNVSGVRDSLPASHYERVFNGLQMSDTNNTLWRVNVGSDGKIYTVQY